MSEQSSSDEFTLEIAKDPFYCIGAVVFKIYDFELISII